jgi:hypothetical protein
LLTRQDRYRSHGQPTRMKGSFRPLNDIYPIVAQVTAPSRGNQDLSGTNEIQKWRCPFCGLKIEDQDSKSFRQRVIFHRKMHDEK